jgi:hypothetical protein
MKKLTPFQKIMRAADKGKGCRLTPDDVKRLSLDHAVYEAAECDNEDKVEDDDLTIPEKTNNIIIW